MCVASAGLILASCGGKDEKGSDASKDANSGKGQNTESQTACDCVKNVNNELNKFLNMSIQEIQKNPQVGEEFKMKVDNMMKTGKCAELMKNIQKEYESPEAFMKVCPEIKEMMETTQKLQNLGAQEGNEMDTTDF